MPRNHEQETTCELPRFLAERIKVLIATNRTPAKFVSEYVRQAVAKQVEEDEHKPRLASVPDATPAGSGFVAESATASARGAFGPARSDRRFVPGIETPDSERAVGVGGN